MPKTRGRRTFQGVEGDCCGVEFLEPRANARVVAMMANDGDKLHA